MERTEQFLSVDDGLRLRYCTLGTGDDVVVIPGACWLDVDWEPLIAGRTLVFYDSRGRGGSDTVTDQTKIGLRQEVQDLEALRQHLQLRQICLVGWSYLAAVVAHYVRAYPDHVSRLLLIGALPLQRSLFTAKKEPEAAALRARAAARVDPAGAKQLKKMRQTGVSLSDPRSYCRAYNRVYLPERLGDPTAITRMRNDPCSFPNEWPDNVQAFFRVLFSDLGNWNWRRDMAHISTPTLVIHGTEDTILLAASQDWAATLQNARLLVMDGVGHFPWLDAPDRFFAAADTFLLGHWPMGVESARATV
jgi:proline iminopeptidase